ncbi:hypothetical protein VCRA2120O333_10468 [Vibrio crassostreae]|nr:hypothetical protein VCRA2113O324_20373 [Vibrio crassostreae]CAK2015042.1 hypothetical protein VCRA2113O322_20516 [Vibrio crassostreae]CAK2017010.1 hypothetical protein VCRA2113O326_20212 [Vibrio crassostreae]CAK2481899.1 hypothetical protein VCRA2114E327_30474 [Vibrio crassostreae]CAK3409280.1 hypothetical protein VCRA2123E342_20452 [Vibrio crassostreae]
MSKTIWSEYIFEWAVKGSNDRAVLNRMVLLTLSMNKFLGAIIWLLFLDAIYMCFYEYFLQPRVSSGVYSVI